MYSYCYTIFDDNPNTSSGTAWPDYKEKDLIAESDSEAIEIVYEVMEMEAKGLHVKDGYHVNDKLYAIVWFIDNNNQNVEVDTITYTITKEDLGL